MGLAYPNAEIIREFARLIGTHDSLLEYLPPTDQHWASVLEGDFSLCQIHPDSQDLYKVSARLFYRVTKNHHFPDGNKRSALIALYLFIYTNHATLELNWNEAYALAKEIAATNIDSETMIRNLSERFAKCILISEVYGE